MKVSKENANEKVQEVIVEISKEDYIVEVEKRLKKQRRLAQIPGFRQGNAPMGMIKKMYEKPMIAETVNELASKSLYEYVEENKTEYIFEPMVVNEKSIVDFENAENFVFVFELALKPAFEVNFTELPIITDFHIKASEKEIEDYSDQLRRKYGEFSSPSEVGEDDNISVMYGENKNGFILISNLSEEGKQSIVGKTINETVNMNLKNAFVDEMQLKKFLHATDETFDKEADYNFDVTITHIGRLTKAELNEDFFKKVAADGSITTEEQFKDYVATQVEEQWLRETNQKFMNDAITTLIDNTAIELPEDFIRRFIMQNNPEMTAEKIDADFDRTLTSIKWSLIENEIVKDTDVKVSMDDIREYVRNFFLKNYFAQFSYEDVKDQLDSIVEEAMKKKEDVKHIYDELYDKKLVNLLRSKLNIELKEGSFNEFVEFVSNKKAEEQETKVEEQPKTKKTTKKTTKKDKDE